MVFVFWGLMGVVCSQVELVSVTWWWVGMVLASGGVMAMDS